MIAGQEIILVACERGRGERRGQKEEEKENFFSFSSHFFKNVTINLRAVHRL